MNIFSKNQIADKLGHTEGRLSWQAPSNIALIKYWGKYNFQLPANPSISMTLNKSHTKCEMLYKCIDNQDDHEVTLEFMGKTDIKFGKKLEAHVTRLSNKFPILKQFTFHFKTENTFPHSTGIASSASSMAAVNLCLGELLLKLDLIKESDFFDTCSDHARLGSGSACRSVFGGFVEWGLSSKTNAGIVTDIHESFQDMGDAVLIVDSSPKKVSSSEGHKAMMKHPFKDVRFQSACKKTLQMVEILKSGDWQQFISMLETEALELHGLMMSGTPWFVLMRPNTLELVEKLRAFREEAGARMAFTLDAGPNIHLLYHKDEKELMLKFVNTVAMPYLENKRWIDDSMGDGPVRTLP